MKKLLNLQIPMPKIAIGDRFDLDVQLPLQMGMGGIEVSGVEDLYDLHTLLK